MGNETCRASTGTGHSCIYSRGVDKIYIPPALFIPSSSFIMGTQVHTYPGVDKKDNAISPYIHNTY